MAKVSGRRFALAALCAVAVLSLAAAVPLTVLSGQLGDGLTAWAIGIPCACVGFLVARRQPGNPLGWLFLLCAGCLFTSNDAVDWLYAGLVLLATQVLKFHSTVAVAAATLAAAALFNPLRRRVQQLVDRRFNRARYDADQTVAVFAVRLKDAVDLDSVRDDLAGVVQQALEPAHVSVWVSRHNLGFGFAC